ncbi:histone PARylation factor 1-like isoform X1 [Anopheles stephensi]|uniref:histone PARylation factor 1-like isoform X1 n=1 Tax=Anopheles stephensi TaxID=30069 RepID=UPI0007D4CFE1|nr:histone PARylation factor 1-like isoform X1 [Anopheles stephensi]XP_035920028.1 histone PARylation factor 1-like isoform X1 [Anopheles stephensi]
MDKPDCKYGASCYQKNPAHKEKYAHPVKATTDAPTAEASVLPDDGTINKRAGANIEQELEDIKRCKRPPTPERDEDNTEAADAGSEYHGMSRQRYTLPTVPMSVGMMSDLYDPQIEYSKQAEYKELCEDPRKFIKHKFLVEMAPCFDSLWEFCTAQGAKANTKPEDVFLPFGLLLVGPYDALAGKFKDVKIHEPGDYLRHWRFYFDPPEFQTVFIQKGTGMHYGYWRDSPDDVDGLVACNDVKKGCEFKIVGENLFDGLLHYLENVVTVTPFNKSKILDMKKQINDWAQQKGIRLKASDKQQARNKLVVCKTFHKVGLVVPYDRKQDVGYRPLLESDAKLRRILSKFDKLDRSANMDQYQEAMKELQPIITAANLAVDECDFGTMLELALDLFCSGAKSLTEVMKPLFFTGYSMAKRPQYIAIIKSHLDKRSEGICLDLLANN